MKRQFIYTHEADLIQWVSLDKDIETKNNIFKIEGGVTVFDEIARQISDAQWEER